MTAPELSPYLDFEQYPGEHIQTDDELLQVARERGTTTYHLMGASLMGPDSDPTAVVDSDLRVKGIKGLRVADASIMPTMLSSNLNAGALMIGEKASDLVLGKKPLEPIIDAIQR
jgi:choline dehydrogenase